jgi:hypothetical protein
MVQEHDSICSSMQLLSVLYVLLTINCGSVYRLTLRLICSFLAVISAFVMGTKRAPSRLCHISIGGNGQYNGP